VIARNHLVEAALAAAENEDMRPFESLLAAVRRPFDDGVAQAAFMPPPAPAARVTQTFCGT
jgi:serine/tyrosine/threonine adenylyltransferase